MLNSRRVGWRQDRGRAMTKKAGLYGQNRNCQGSGLKVVGKTRRARGIGDVNGAGMYLKVNEMRKCHPHQGFWRRGEVGDFALREAGKANPSGSTHAVAIKYKDYGPKRTQAGYLPWNLSVTTEIRLFSVNLNADSPVPSRIRSLESFRCSLPSLDQTDWRKAAGRRSAARGGTRVLAKPGQHASATTEELVLRFKPIMPLKARHLKYAPVRKPSCC